MKDIQEIKNIGAIVKILKIALLAVALLNGLSYHHLEIFQSNSIILKAFNFIEDFSKIKMDQEVSHK